jgi:hypothetical protein
MVPPARSPDPADLPSAHASNDAGAGTGHARADAAARDTGDVLNGDGVLEPLMDAWPAPTPQRPPAPLIDLQAAWAALGAASGQEEATLRAEVIADELNWYMIAPREGGTMQKMSRDRYGDLRAEFEQDVDAPASDDGDENSKASGEQSNKEKSGNDLRVVENAPVMPSSVYGEPLTLALSCEDKSVKKVVPLMTHAAITALLAETAAYVQELSEDHTRFAFADAINMKLVSPLFCILIEASEIRLAPLRNAARIVIAFAAENANPREFHVMLKAALSRISDSFFSEVSALVIDDLIAFWTASVPRITGKRALFLRDIAETLNRAYFENDGRDAPHHQDLAATHDPLFRETAICKFLEAMLDVQLIQKKHSAESESGSRASNALNHENVYYHEVGANREYAPGTEATTTETAEAVNRSKIGHVRKTERELAKEITVARKEADDREQDTHDFQTECGTTRSLLFKTVEAAMEQMPLPETRMELRCSRSQRSSTRESSRKGVSAEHRRLETFLASSRRLFGLSGFDNPVDACQQASQLLSMGAVNADSVIAGIVASPKTLRKRKAETFFSLRAMSCYLIVSLNVSAVCDIPSGNRVKDMLSRSAFALLDPMYALELVMPLLLTAVGDLSPAMSLAGIELTAAFVDVVPNGCVETMSNSIDASHGSLFAQTDASWYGLATALSMATGRMDNPEHRGFAYEALQAVLRKIASPYARFGIVSILLLQAERAAMSAQLITELKDCVRAVDTAGEEKHLAEDLRTRLVELCLPRFLLPRKEILAGLNPAVAASNAGLYVAMSDSNSALSLDVGWYNKEEHAGLCHRLVFIRMYVKLGREAMRAMASVAEHDVNSIPSSNLAKKRGKDARALFEAANRSLNDCIASIASMDLALDKISAVLQ